MEHLPSLIGQVNRGLRPGWSLILTKLGHHQVQFLAWSDSILMPGRIQLSLPGSLGHDSLRPGWIRLRQLLKTSLPINKPGRRTFSMPKLTIDGSAVSCKGICVDFEAPQARKFCNLHYLGMYFQVRNCILMLQKHKKFLGAYGPQTP